MIKVNQISKRKSLKLTAFLITVTIIISSTPAFVIVTIPETTPTAYLIPHTENTPDSNDIFQRTPQEHSFLTSDWNNMSSDTSPGSSPEVNVTVDSLGIAIEFDIKGFWEGNITLDGIDYDTITIPGAFSKTVPGDPAIPRISMYLEVPHEIDIAVDVTHVDSTVLGGYKIYPYQIPAISLPNITRNPVVFNSATNTTNAFYPYVNATINGGLETSSIIMRGRRLVVLSVYPIQFNPVTGQLRTYSHMEIQLTYSEEADIQPVDASLYSATFENLFQSLTLNFVPMVPPQFNTTPSFSVLPGGNLLAQSSTLGAEYLIIVYDEFYSAALDLAEWKTRKGVPTEVIGTSQIFGDTDLVNELVSASQTSLNPKINTLKQYLQNIYQTWSPVPTYVLFLGDSEHIPCDYSIEHTGELSDETRVHGDSSVNKIATDVPYFCIQSESYFPDIIHGRLSVSTLTEAQAVVNKIIAYETEPSYTEQFYSDVMVSSFFEDKYVGMSSWISSDGWEDEDFMEPAVDVANHLRNFQYIIHEGFTKTDLIPPESDKIPDILFWGEEVPDVSWDASTFTIKSNISAGRFLVCHTDHGSSRNLYIYGMNEYGQIDGWDHPRFTTDTVQSELSNQNRLPFVLSMECCTGWFDGETDGFIDDNLAFDSSLASVQYTSFAESITRKNLGGAIGIIAPTRTSFNTAAGKLMRGVVDAIWPGMLSYLYLEVEIKPVYNLGAALKRGKLYVQTQYAIDSGDFQEGDITMLIYHLFGDPETPLWTGYPTTLEGVHSSSIILGRQDFEISVTDENGVVEDAMVCLWKDSEVYERWETDQNGLASISINPQTTGTLKVTVTKHNSRPHQMDIPVTNGEPCPLLLVIGMGIPAIIALVLAYFWKKKTENGD